MGQVTSRSCRTETWISTASPMLPDRGHYPSRAQARTTAAFFDLDKTIISRSSTLAFVPSFYRHGLITRSEAAHVARVAQLIFRLAGAGHERMERIRDQVSELCRGWPAERVSEIVTGTWPRSSCPLRLRRRPAAARRAPRAGHDVIIVSTSGQEMVGPIGAMLGASEVIATRMEVADGPLHRRDSSSTPTARPRRAGSANWPPSAATGSPTATPTATRSPTCRCSRPSGHPHVVNPDRALRKIARERRLAGRSALRLAGPLRGSRHVNRQIDRDNESITPGRLPSPPIRRRKETRTTGPDTATGYPRATSRGRRAVAGKSQSSTEAPGARQRRCTLGNPA